MITELSSESATGKAIVLVPDALDATGAIEVVVFLHGFTEGAFRPYAGWRQLVDPKPKTAGLGKVLGSGSRACARASTRRHRAGSRRRARPGRAAARGERPDAARDRAPAGRPEVAVRQGGGTDFDAGPYVSEIVTRLRTEKRWRDGSGQVVDASPSVRRVTMAGHSGAGAALSNMTNEAVKAKRGEKPGKSSALTGDLVIYDAINGSQLGRFKQWARMRLDEDFAFLTDPSISDDAKLYHLQSAPKLRGFTTDTYISAYIELDDDIEDWFAKHSKKLGPWAPCLRANFALDFVDVSHEELMRGSLAGRPRAAGTGTILQAIRDLHPPRFMSPAACPAMPKTLRERHAAAKKKATGR